MSTFAPQVKQEEVKREVTRMEWIVVLLGLITLVVFTPLAIMGSLVC